MKKSAKFLAVTLAALLGAGNAYAAVTIDSDMYDGDKNALNVKGTVTGAKANIPVGLIISKEGTQVFADYIVATGKNADGDIEYSFAPYVLDIKAPGGTFDINVYTDITHETGSTAFTYVSASDKLAILKDLQDVTKVATTLGAKYADINLDISKYNAVGDKTELDVKLAACIKDLPDDCSTDENCEKVLSKVTEFNKAYTELCCNYELAQVTDEAGYNAWKTRYYNSLDMGTEFDAYYDRAVANASYIERIKKLTAGETAADVKQKIFDCVFLEIIQYGKYLDAMDMVSKFPTYIDLSAQLANLTALQISKKYEGSVPGTYADVAAFKTAFGNVKVTNPTTTTTTPSSPSKVGISTGITTPQTNQQSSKEASFEDTASVAWAQEAINACYKKGIISGRTETVFAPQDNVTRAEFIKMLTIALNKSVSAEITFTDVSADDWFYKYVKNAYALGLVYGGSDNRFRPNDCITRQDMAVMIYRALENTTEGDEFDFADREQIADYALNAVGYLYQNNLISGIGDNLFAPLANTTRAEAASIIYRVFLK